MTEIDALVSYERGRGEVARFSNDDWRMQLVAFDGNVAYVGQILVIPGASQYQLAAYAFGVDAPPAVVGVDAIVKSLVALDDGLAAGFETQLLTVHPHCPAE
jgi:hypothetical protein